MTIRWATLWEIPQAISFLMRNHEKNHFDHGVLTYPSTKLLRAGDASAVAYMPVHTGAILESLGWADGVDAENKLAAATAMVTQVATEAHALGYRELYFISSDERTDESALKLGFEKVSCLRKRI